VAAVPSVEALVPPPILQNSAEVKNLPPVIHVCAQICMTLELKDGRYISTSHNAWDPPGFHSVWAFESFKADSIIVHRYDPPHPTNPGGLVVDVTYRGQMSADGTQLVNPKLNDQSVALSMGWGAALALVPGNDADAKRFGDQSWKEAEAAAARARRAQQVALAMPVPAACEANPAAPTPAAVRSSPLQLSFCECENPDCPGAAAAIWSLDGNGGYAVWPNSPTIAELTVERFDAGGVIIRRRDRTSAQLGLTALYTGSIRGNEIEGDVTWEWSGFRGGAAHGHWHAVIGSAADQRTLSQYQQDVREAINNDFWHGIVDMLSLAGAVGGAASDSQSNVPSQVHKAVYEGKERRAHPR